MCVWNFLWSMLMTLDQGHTATKAVQILLCSCNEIRTTYPIMKIIISLVMLLNWLNLWGILLGVYFAKFLPKFWLYFLHAQTFSWSHLKNSWADWCEMKRKYMKWMLGHLYDLDLWPYPWPWPWIFMVKFWNISISGMLGWFIWKEKDVSQ